MNYNITNFEKNIDLFFNMPSCTEKYRSIDLDGTVRTISLDNRIQDPNSKEIIIRTNAINETHSGLIQDCLKIIFDSEKILNWDYIGQPFIVLELIDGVYHMKAKAKIFTYEVHLVTKYDNFHKEEYREKLIDNFLNQKKSLNQTESLSNKSYQFRKITQEEI